MSGETYLNDILFHFTVLPLAPPYLLLGVIQRAILRLLDADFGVEYVQLVVVSVDKCGEKIKSSIVCQVGSQPAIVGPLNKLDEGLARSRVRSTYSTIRRGELCKRTEYVLYYLYLLYCTVLGGYGEQHYLKVHLLSILLLRNNGVHRASFLHISDPAVVNNAI